MRTGIRRQVSTEEQVRGNSPKNHEYRAKTYTSLKDWHVAKSYDLSDVSGKFIIEHPKVRRMLTNVASGKIQALIFSKLVRLASNVRALLDIADYFQKHNANLVSLKENIDKSTLTERFTVIGALAQSERSLLN